MSDKKPLSVLENNELFDSPNRVRFNSPSEYIEFERHRAESQAKSSIKYYVHGGFNTRFCPACQQKKPRGKRKATKAWRCDDCLAKKAP